jgi:hypothetical protein
MQLSLEVKVDGRIDVVTCIAERFEPKPVCAATVFSPAAV